MDTQEKLAARNVVARSIAEDSYATIESFLRGLLESFRAGSNRSVSNVFYVGFIVSQSHSNSAIDDGTLHSSRDAAWKDSEGSAKTEYVVNTQVDAKVIEL